VVEHLQAGKALRQALKHGMEQFRAVAEGFGYSPFEAYDAARVYGVLEKVAACENRTVDEVLKQASQIRFVKLSLIVQVIDKQPSAWLYWLDMAENLPLQDLQQPVVEALRELSVWFCLRRPIYTHCG